MGSRKQLGLAMDTKVGEVLSKLPDKDRQVLEAHHDRLRKEAVLDPMFEGHEIYNRRGFLEKVGSIAEMAREGKLKQVVILMGDIDKFKEINDCINHKFGDKVLRMVAKGFGKGLKKGDVMCKFVGRFGGDEFVAAMPVFNDRDDFTEETLAKRIEEIQAIIESDRKKMADGLPEGQEWPMVDGKVAGRISLGGKIFTVEEFLAVIESGDALGKLTEVADEELYRAKRNKS